MRHYSGVGLMNYSALQWLGVPFFLTSVNWSIGCISVNVNPVRLHSRHPDCNWSNITSFTIGNVRFLLFSKFFLHVSWWTRLCFLLIFCEYFWCHFLVKENLYQYECDAAYWPVRQFSGTWLEAILCQLSPTISSGYFSSAVTN